MTLTTNEQAAAIIARGRSRGMPMPDRAWASFQSWDNLLTCHWPLDPSLLRAKVPAELEIDTYGTQAWISLLPMFMGRIELRDIGSIPTERHFAELNFRTYVRYGGRPGVYFFHVYAHPFIADLGARLFFHTPYELAEVACERSDAGEFSFRSRRPLPPHETFEATYRPRGTPAPCPPGSLTEFLAERYSAFARTATGEIVRGDLVHDPWLLQDVDADVSVNTILPASGFDLPATPPLMHYAAGVDVVLWTFETARQAT